MKKIGSAILAIAMALQLPVWAAAATVVSSQTHPSEAREVLEYVNDERKEAGLQPLSWNTTLAGYANTRAKEIVRKFSHTRPNGEKATSYPGCNGENIAMGAIYSAQEVVDGWMSSQEHRENILDPDFVSMNVACLEQVEEMEGYGEVSVYYWVQLFHSNKTVNADGTVIEASAEKSSASAPATAPKGGAVASGTVTAAVKKSGSATVKDASTISAATLGDMAAANKNAVLVARTTFPDTGKVQGQMTLNAADFTGIKSDLKLGVYAESSNGAAALKQFKKWYANSNMAVIHIEQSGALPGTVKISAKVNLSDFDTDNLLLYSYNKKSKTMIEIEAPAASYKNGTLQFTTNQGDYILILDSKLAKK